MKDKKVKQAFTECDNDKEVKESSSMDEIRERRERVETVQQLFRDVHYKTDAEKDAAILSFVKSKMTIPEIEAFAKMFQPEYLKSKEASMNTQIRKVGVW